MGQLITKPDANPIVFAIANLFIFGGLGYFLMGQKKKAYITWGIYFGAMILTCGFLGIVSVALAWITTYDAYLLGQKLQSGQSIGENENGLAFLNSIFKD
jgi:TM2 domain-containing membrane protein YozV